MPILKVGLAQTRQSADFDRNAATIFRFVEEAGKAGVQILCFPETQTVGYRVDITPTDAPVEPDRLRDLHQRVAKCCGELKMACILGTETPLESNPLKGKPYNSALTISPEGKILGVHHKTKLTPLDAVAYSAGVYGNVFGPDPRVDFFLIRGFTANDTGLYRDGLQLFNYGFAAYKVDTFGLERIDVLRGPASVLFGQGGPGGLINLISKKPPFEPLNYVEVGGGSFGQKYLAFDFGGPADKEGHWFYRLTGIGRQGGTQVDGLDEGWVILCKASGGGVKQFSGTGRSAA